MSEADDIVISYFALDQDYLDAFAEFLGRPVKNVVVSALIGGGIRELIRRLRLMSCDNAYIPCSDPDRQLFVPLLRLAALLPSCRKVMLVEENFHLAPAAAMRSAAGGIGLAVRAAMAVVAGQVRRRRLQGLLKLERSPAVLPRRADKVLYIDADLSPAADGKAAAKTSGVVGALAALNYRIAYAAPGLASDLSRLPGVTVNHVPIPFGYVYPLELNAVRSESQIEAWLSKLDRGDIRFIYHRLGMGGGAAVAASRRLGVPLAMGYDGSGNRRRNAGLQSPKSAQMTESKSAQMTESKSAQTVEDVCLRHAHLIVVASESLKKDLIVRGVEPERIMCRPNGVDPDIFDPDIFDDQERREIRRKYGLADDDVVAAFVGDFGQEQSAGLLVEALLHLALTCGAWLETSKLKLLFIGDGDYRRVVLEGLCNVAAAERAVFTGPVRPAALPALLAACDVFVAPQARNASDLPQARNASDLPQARNASDLPQAGNASDLPQAGNASDLPQAGNASDLPTALFECMAMGKPILAGLAGRVAEVMNISPILSQLPAQDGAAASGEFGILLPPGDARALALALQFIIDHPLWRRSCGAQARQRVVEHYSWRAHMGAVLDRLQDFPDRPNEKSDRVKVLINAVHSKSGGGLTYLRNILPRLEQNPKIEVSIVVQRDQQDLVEKMMIGAPVHIVPSVSRIRTVLVQEQFDIPRLARKLGAQVVFSPANYGPVRGCNSVIMLRNAFEVGTLEQRLSKRVYWLAVKILSLLSLMRCRRAIVVSNYSALRFLRALHWSSDPRLEVVHHGVSAAFHPPADDGNRIDDQILAVSDIYIQKNLHTLLEALAVLRRSNPRLRLLVAGRPLDLDYYELLKSRCADLDLTDAVTFLGGVSADEVSRLYQTSKVFVFPSTVETFGNPLLEAMASGIPVVCSSAAAMPEVAGDCAVYFRPEDPEDMAAALQAMLTDPVLWKRYARRGPARAARFNWDRTAEITANVLAAAAD